MDPLRQILCDPSAMTGLTASQWTGVMQRARRRALLGKLGALAQEEGCIDALPAAVQRQFASMVRLAEHNGAHLKAEAFQVLYALRDVENALFRHKDVVELRDETEEDPSELRANDVGLNYVHLDGEIGCMVNGAGLAMATMDIIKLHGGEPANFLDVGGGANEDQITEAFKIILSDDRVKAILVNIFGGIMRCDVIARGIEAAVKKAKLEIPLVVRLEGTNVEEGRRILKETGLEIITGTDMSDAAQKAVAAAKKASGVA